MTTKLLIFGAALLMGMSVSAQPPQLVRTTTADRVNPDAKIGIDEDDIQLLRKDLRDQKKQLVAVNLPLTGDEAAKFWPLYDEYTQETIKVNDQRYALVEEYAMMYNTMTDEQAANFIRRWVGVDEQAVKLRSAWIPKFESAVGPKKAAIFTQLDRRVGMMIELQLASVVPLVKP